VAFPTCKTRFHTRYTLKHVDIGAPDSLVRFQSSEIHKYTNVIVDHRSPFHNMGTLNCFTRFVPLIILIHLDTSIFRAEGLHRNVAQYSHTSRLAAYLLTNFLSLTTCTDQGTPSWTTVGTFEVLYCSHRFIRPYSNLNFPGCQSRAPTALLLVHQRESQEKRRKNQSSYVYPDMRENTSRLHTCML
jgi:hypothetical protein